ncbi:hypothetical protein WMF04_47375 [Sorangium sp. So ce260]|uniref:tetratricopeptide repeat protein n=1 Tax=Sorangium sp. So ce260 TaxID=3133291 RepID=UPI003F63D1FC
MLLLASRAGADPTAEDRAAADALFREGRALVKQGKHAEACPKLAASQKLDPTAGTLLALGDCYQGNGQTASAWATFNDAGARARKSNDTMRAEEAARRAAALEPQLSMLVIEVAPEHRGAGLEVRRNEKPVEADLLGSAIPVDPGEHVIEAAAPGKQAWSTRVHVEPKRPLTTVRIPALAAASAPSAVVEPTPAPTQGAPTSGADRSADAWSRQRTVGLALGGAGVVGVAVGTVFGIQTLSKVGQVEEKKYCTNDAPPRCTQQGYDLHHAADTTANVANVAFAIGGTALIAGAVVFLTAPRGETRSAGASQVTIEPAVAIGTAGLSVRGAW